MSYWSFESDFYCVGGTHRSDTKNVCGVITSEGSKKPIGYCSFCSREKFLTVSDNTIQAKGLGDFFKNFGKKGFKISKKMAENVIKNPRRALDTTKINATAAASRNPKASLSTLPGLITFNNTG